MKTMSCLMLTAMITVAGASLAIADPYTLSTCPVSGQKIGSMGEAVVKEYDDREVRFCCTACVETFETDPATHWARIDKELITAQEEQYPLDTCVVGGEKLGSMGDPVKHIHQNRLVQFCCAGCVDSFTADPATYLKKLDEAVIEAQKDSYPLSTCVVSDEALGSRGEPVDLVVANRLVRLCCEDCKAGFEKDPAAYLEKLDHAAKS